MQISARDGKIQFDRLKPAEYFAANSAELRESISQESLFRFDELFKMLNSAII
jgi:hypothetical protein